MIRKRAKVVLLGGVLCTCGLLVSGFQGTHHPFRAARSEGIAGRVAG